MEERIEWIDTAKGFAMILVIAGHTIGLKYSYPIYSFHMPLFFFLSGLVYNANKYNSFQLFFAAKTKQILRPYAIIYLISLLVTLAIPQLKDDLSIRGILTEFYTVNTNSINNSSIWFLICLFVIMLYFYGLNYITNQVADKKRDVIQTIILLALSILSVYLIKLQTIISLPLCRAPFKMDSAVIGLIFFSLGAWYKQGFINYIQSIKSIQIIILGVILLFGSVLNGFSNVNSMSFGKVALLYYPIALCGILFTLCFFSKIQDFDNKIINTGKNILKFYGMNSLLIFGFQSLYIRIYLFVFNNIENLDMQLYVMNPIRHQIGSFLVVTFICTPATAYLFKYLKKKQIKLL